MADLNMTFEEYVEWFKALLVNHRWTVTQAYSFDGSVLKEYYDQNLHRNLAFEKVFKQEPFEHELALPNEIS